MITLKVTLDPNDPSGRTHRIHGRGWMGRWDLINEIDAAIQHAEALAAITGTNEIIITVAVKSEEDEE